MNDHLMYWPEDLPDKVSVQKYYDADFENYLLRFRYRNTIAIVNTGFTTTSLGKKMYWATIYQITKAPDTKKYFKNNDVGRLTQFVKRHYEKHGYDFGIVFNDDWVIRRLLVEAGLRNYR